MTEYTAREFYSPEAVAQIEALNAVQGQVDLRRATAEASYERAIRDSNIRKASLFQGQMDALDSVTHTLGSIAASIYGKERWK